jgi:hypothetical protein
MKNNKLLRKLAQAYVEYCRTHEGRFPWGGSELATYVESGEIALLDLTCAVADLCTTDTELSKFVLYPLLQDLLYHPTEYLPQYITVGIQQSFNFKRAIQMLYLPPNTKTRILLEEMLENNGLLYGLLASQEYPYGEKLKSTANNSWAWHWFHDHPPELKIVCLFMDNCKKDEHLISFAKGPFTQLVQQGGDSILSELDDLAWKSKRVRRALCGVVVEPDTIAAEVLDQLLTKYKLAYNSL